MIKHSWKVRLLVIIFLIPTACLKVTPKDTVISVVSGETTDFTATRDIKNAELVWESEKNRGRWKDIIALHVYDGNVGTCRFPNLPSIR